MKKFIFCILFITVISCSSLFAGGGVGIFVPLGASISQYKVDREGKTTQSDRLKSDVGFEFGVSFQPGYFFGFGNAVSFALLADLGYYRDTYAYKFRDKTKGSLTFDSINVGLYPKINLLFLSIGVGGGVKLPLGGSEKAGGITSKWTHKNIKDRFVNAYIPYLKVSLDFPIKFGNHFALALGIYFNYDFPMKVKSSSPDKETISSFDVGFQVGMYIVGS